MQELGEFESRLKEILYNCLERIQSTKAALYLSKGDGGPFELISEYGFRNKVRKQIDPSDELIDILLLKRAPFFVNSVGEDTRFAELLDKSSTSRMLVAPVYSRGRLYGLIDMRDKPGQKEFDFADSDTALEIARMYLTFFEDNGIFGHEKRSTPLVELPVDEEATLIRSPEGVQTFRSSAKVVDEAKRYLERGGLRSRTVSRTLTDEQSRVGSAVLPGILSIPGVALCAFSSFSELGGYQVVVARAPVPDNTLEQFQLKLKGWLQKNGEPDKITDFEVQYPFGKLGTPITPERLATTLSAPLKIEGFSGLVLTVSFEVQPSMEQKNLLEEFLLRLERIVRGAIGSSDLSTMKQKVAAKLLEPDFAHYPHLKNHSERVADLAERFGYFVGMSRDEVETIRLAAFLHDVGMRVLDYGALYRKESLMSSDLDFLRAHPVVGAALVAESPLGPEVGRLVLHHHERPDGEGYPDGLLGDDIPLGSKMIHICESFDAMVAQDSYQATVSVEAAVGKIKRAGGTQFDEALAERFEQMMGKEL